MPASTRKQLQKQQPTLADDIEDEDDELDTSFVVDENAEQQAAEDEQLDAEMENDDAEDEDLETAAPEEEEELSMEEKIARVLNKQPRDKRSFGDLVAKDDDLSYDLGNLMCFDTHAIDIEKYK